MRIDRKLHEAESSGQFLIDIHWNQDETTEIEKKPV